MSDILWVVDYYVTCVVRVNIPVVNRSSVICRRHTSSVLRSVVSNCADRYVDCDGQMSREVSYVEWFGTTCTRIIHIILNLAYKEASQNPAAHTISP
jgi:hypothetical protein